MSAESISPEPDLPLDPLVPFTRAAALRSGLTDRDLRSARFQQLFRGVHVTADLRRTPELMARAALLVHAGCAQAHLSHATAARLYGLPLPTIPDEHVTVPEQTARRRRSGLVTHVAPSGAVIERHGLRVSSPERTFAELATQLNLVDLVVVGDHLIRQRLTTLPALDHVLTTCPLPRAEAARAAFAHVRAGVDSVLETRTRMLMVLAGLPEPEINLVIRDAGGAVLRRHDLGYAAQRLIIEVDGRTHIEAKQSWKDDLLRREESDGDGWRMVVVIGRDIYRTPSRTVQRLHRALCLAGVPGVPARPSDAWRAYFPG